MQGGLSRYKYLMFNLPPLCNNCSRTEIEQAAWGPAGDRKVSSKGESSGRGRCSKCIIFP